MWILIHRHTHIHSLSLSVHVYSPTTPPVALVPCSKLSVDAFRSLDMLDSLQGWEHSLLLSFLAWDMYQEPNRVPDSGEWRVYCSSQDGGWNCEHPPSWLLRAFLLISQIMHIHQDIFTHTCYTSNINHTSPSLRDHLLVSKGNGLQRLLCFYPKHLTLKSLSVGVWPIDTFLCPASHPRSSPSSIISLVWLSGISHCSREDGRGKDFHAQ